MSFETIEQRYPNSFTDNWVTNLHHYTPAFVIFQGDTLHQNTIDDSNVETIYQELIGEFPHEVHRKTRPYVEEVYVHVDDLESNEELAEKVLEILKALEDYAIYDETHHSDLETSRFEEYIANELAWEISRELYFLDETDDIQAWIGENMDKVYENCDGSIDDYPFNTEKLAELYKKA